MNRLFASWVPGCLLMIPIAGAVVAAGPAGDIVPRSPADLAGASPGSHLIAINGHKWSKDLLHDTLSAPPDPAGSITLLVQKDDMYKTLELKYSGGERYPNLSRRPGTEDLLAKIAHPRAAP